MSTRGMSYTTRLAAVIIILLFTATFAARAQDVPQAMNYQAAARDSIGMPLAGRNIGVRLSILPGSATGQPVYVENHATTTDDLGLFTVAIGRGKPELGTFPAIDWSRRDYWLKVELDISGKGIWSDLGAQQLLSVPYALFAQRAARADTALVAYRTINGTSSSDSSGWHLRGNRGTDATKDYLGTGDSTDLVMRTNGAERLRIGADGSISVAGLTPGGNRIVTFDNQRGGRLGSGTIIDMMDSTFWSTIRTSLMRDSIFIERLTVRIDSSIRRDSTFIRNISSDSIFITKIRASIDSLRLRDSLLIAGLARDSVFIKTIIRNLDTLRRRDTLVIRDSISVTQLVRQIDTLLLRDSVFMGSLINDSLFTARIRAVGAATFWSLAGSTGTDPARNFLGTIDAKALAIRTENVERIRVNAGNGFVGVGTALPAERLHVAGNIRSDNLAGSGARLLIADSAGTIRSASNPGALIAPLVDTILSHDQTFITALITDHHFTEKIKSVGDSTYWSLGGSNGTDPARNYIGTSDNAPLSIRTNGTERLRVGGNGFIGIGTALPAERLHVAGNIRSDSLSGVGIRILTSDPAGTVRASTNIAPLLLPQIDTLLAVDATFINALTGGNGFIGRIRNIGDTMFWSLKGSSNIDPTKTFLGSIDNTPLAIRTNNTERIRVAQGTGFVGIGTTTPSERLHVAGNIRSDSMAGTGNRLAITDANGTIRATTNASAIILPQIDSALGHDATFINNLTADARFTGKIKTFADSTSWSLMGTTGTNPVRNFLGTTDNAALAIRTNNAERIRVDATGLVGIGTAAPTERLDVVGNIKSTGLAGTGNRLTITDANGTIRATTNASAIILPQIDSALGHDATFINNLTADAGFTSKIKTFADSTSWSLTGTTGTNPVRNFLGTIDNAALAIRTNNAERIRVDATGLVGIGTAAPTERLDVVGNIKSTGLAGTGTRLAIADASGTVRATTNASAIILPQIDSALGHDVTFINNLTADAGFNGKIKTFADSTSWSLMGTAGTNPVRNFLGTTDNAALAIRTNNAERIRVNATGLVGIGTTTPTEQLDVVGNIKSTGLAGTGTRLAIADASGTVRATTNASAIILPQIDSALGHDVTFINNLTADAGFTSKIKTFADSTSWSLTGTAGTNPTRNFLGTTDNAALAIRTNNAERIRIDAAGLIGIGTTAPTERLDVVGNIKSSGLAGTGNRLAITDANGTIRATTNASAIILPQIDSALGHDATFINNLTADAGFTGKIKTFADSTSWSLMGTAGTNPTRNFLGTIDNAALAIRTNNAERIRVDAAGFVGIGTAAPTERLDVVGNIKSSGLAGTGNRLAITDANGILRATTNASSIILPQIDSALGHDVTFINNLTADAGFSGKIKTLVDSSSWSLTGAIGTNPTRNFLGTIDNAALAIRTNNTERIRVDANGAVGIGTTTPGAKLHVAGDIRSDSMAGTGNRLVITDANGIIRATTNASSIILPQIDSALGHDVTFINNLTADAVFNSRVKTVVDSSSWSLTGAIGTNPSRNFLGTIDNAALAIRTNNTERIRVAATGFVGIGTTSPTEQLDVAGNIKSSGLAGAGNRLIMADAGGIIRTATNIGATILPLIDSALGHDATFITNLTADAGFTGRLKTFTDSTSWSLRGSAGTDPTRNFLGTTDNQPLAIRTNNTERIRIDAAGAVGIGTTSPGGRLDVQNGNLLISNTSNIAGELRLQEPSDSGSNYIAFRARPLSTNLVFELPGQQGAANSVLANNGSGILSWVDPGSLISSSLWSVNGNLGLVNAVFGTLDNNPLRFVTGTGGPNERLRIDVNGFVGIGTTTPAHHLHVLDSSATDETAAIHGISVKATTNQAIGIWGGASDTSVTNPGTIGVLATGNNSSAANRTNIALQVNGGAIAVGRTTETGAGYAVVENANGGAAYSSQGASGVIEVNNLGGLLGLLGIGQSLILNRLTINNRYVTPGSIIMVQVLDIHGGTLGGLANLTFSTMVDNRGNGNFKLSVAAHFAGLLPLTLGVTDGIRIGYVVINPSK